MMMKKAWKKTLRIAIWTSFFLTLTIYFVLQTQGVRGVDGVILMLTGFDSFLATLGLFLCLIAAFIADLLYTARFE
jgi:hypothetical protein